MMRWYDCEPCGIRYADIIHDDCPECGNSNTTPTAPETIIRLAPLSDYQIGDFTIKFFSDE
jgi:hypothetical protein